eukprot:g6503.t1
MADKDEVAIGGRANAATALRLLECNPESLLPSRGPGRTSAAKLARQRYEEALKANAVQGDLLDFDTPTTTPKGASAASQTEVEVGDITWPGSSPSTLWPGDVVLARYGPHGAFYRARVVRVYSSRGMSLADVEWIRQDDLANDVLSHAFDESQHRHGLQVGTEVRSIQEAGLAGA